MNLKKTPGPEFAGPARAEAAQKEYRQALSLLAKGDRAGAEMALNRVLSLDPGHADAHYNLGVIRLKDDRLDEAAVSFCKVIELDPCNAAAHYNLGNCRLAARQPEQALEHYRQAVQIDPALALAHNNMGLVLKNTGRVEAAILSFQCALDLESENAAYHQNLGLAYQNQNRHSEAIACFQAALDLAPETPVFHYNLAAACSAVGDYEAAARQLAMAVDLDPDFGDAHHNYGEALGKLGRFESAAESYRHAIRVKPDRHTAWNGLGNALANLGLTGDAMDCYKQAIQLRPDYAGAYINLGSACFADRQLDASVDYFRQALELEPGMPAAMFNLALVHLLEGDLEKGWPGYEKRFEKEEWQENYPFRLDQPKWDGRSFPGRRLLIHDEQGLGDALQFVRFIEQVKPLGGTVLFETRAPLMGLFKNIPGVDRLLERTRSPISPGAYDLHCPLLSLPGILGTTLETIPEQGSYLQADPARTAQWDGRLAGPDFKVGLVWSGNPTHFRGRNRSVLLDDFDRLMHTAGVRFYGFQKGAAAGEADRYADAGLIDNLGTDFGDFGDTAAAMMHMDLVISIDTSVAHLAGSLGKPVWVLLAYAADWRWLLARSDSPWYPTMRLFRQQQKGDWAGVMAQVKEALDTTLKNG
ncbi:MAG: tetratricopeptide repeat protein [Desulfobacterales bacterium]|nr:tetratricopeptide repeat protein [Desulfobacterales bacterium]